MDVGERGFRPERGEIRACRSCEAPILWALTDSGRRMPVDVEPSPLGKLALRRDSDGAIRVEVRSVRSHEPRYRAHFATCPDATNWRRR